MGGIANSYSPQASGYSPMQMYGGQQSRYGTPRSTYRAPATYRNTPAPSYGGGQGGKGGVSTMPPSYGGYGGGGQLHNGATWMPDSDPLDDPMHGKFKAPDGSVVSHRGGIDYTSPSFAPRNYASPMDMPSVADTPENRAAGQQFNGQLSQRFSSKGGVSPMPQSNLGGGNSYADMPNRNAVGGFVQSADMPKSNTGGGFVQSAVMPKSNAQVPSFDPDNPQEDAIKDPKLKKAAKQLNKKAPPGERLAFINPQEEAVLKALGGSGMTAAGGIPSYKKGDIEAPPPRDYAKESRDTLEAQVELAPELYESEAQYRPQYANLERGIMMEQLGLSPDTNLLDAFRTISGAQKDIQRDSTMADIDMIGGMGQQFAEAVRSADPRAEALRQSIMGEAEKGLAEGDAQFKGIAEAQQERLYENKNAYDPLVNRAKVGLEKGEQYDRLIDEAAQARESNPYDQLVSDAQAKRGEDPYARLRDKASTRLDADPYAEVTANAKASLGQDPFGQVEQMASERLQSNPYDELQANARNRMDSNPYAEIVDQAREDYLSGEGLSALESRDLDQRVLEGASARGMEDSSSTLADQIGQKLSADRGIRNQRRDALTQALGMSEGYDRRSLGDYTNLIGQGDEYRRAGMQDYTGVKTLQDDYQRGKLDDYTNLVGQSDQYQRGGMQDFATAEGLSQDYDRTATSDYSTALGQQEGYDDRGLKRFTSALGQREDFGRRMEQDYASALSGKIGLEAALMGDYERALANQQSARQQGLQNASAAYSMGNFDPLMALTGRSGTAPMMAQQGFGSGAFALDSSPAIFNPESSYAGSIAASNQQNIMDARTATAANRAGMFGGLMGGLGSFAGGFFR